jgi:hypothetical protein
MKIYKIVLAETKECIINNNDIHPEAKGEKIIYEIPLFVRNGT